MMRLPLLPAAALALALLAAPRPAAADMVTRESDITSLRLGQRVLVDDGTCPAGQIKEVSGARLTPAGVMRTHRCIDRKSARR